MTSQIVRSFVLASAIVVSAVGCAAPQAEESLEVSEASALKVGGGGGGTLGYTCSGLLCTCTGDDDCNDMFSDGLCGPISSCDESGPEPVCRCLKIFRREAALSTGAPSADVKIAR
jgi:hypothetical protein